MRVVNDLDFEVALVRCESKSIVGDPVVIPKGKEQSVRAGDTCSIFGPTTRSGPFGMIHGDGPYMGCLPLPADSERSGVKVYISALDPEVGFDECDGVE